MSGVIKLLLLAKEKSKLIVLMMATLSMLVLFQNCGSPEAGSKVAYTNNVEENQPLNLDLTKNLSANEGQDLEIGVNQAQLKALGLDEIDQQDLTLEWSHIDENEEVHSINNELLVLLIDKIKETESGTYILKIHTSDKTYVFIFIIKVVVIQNPVDPVGLYEGYWVEPGKEKKLFIRTKNIGKDDALANCKKNANNNPTKGIECYYNKKLIFKRKGKPVAPKLGLYEGYKLEHNGDKRLFIRTKDISRKEALKNCELNANNNPKMGIICYWEGKVIFKRLCKKDRKGVYEGFFILANGKLHRFIRTAKITKVKALANCKLNAKNNPKKSVLCKFNGRVIFKRVVDGGGKKKCGKYKHGAKYTKDLGTIRKPVRCVEGGSKAKIFRKLRRFTCNDGDEKPISRIFIGKYVKTVGRCKGENQ